MSLAKPILALGTVVLVSSCATLFGPQKQVRNVVVRAPARNMVVRAPARVAKPAKVRVAFTRPAPIVLNAAKPPRIAVVKPPLKPVVKLAAATAVRPLLRPAPRPAQAAVNAPEETRKTIRPKPRKTAHILAKTGQIKIGLAKTLTAFASKPAKQVGGALCGKQLVAKIPTRAATAPGGSKFIKTAMDLSGPTRDRAIEKQIFAGNIPPFLSDLTPVSLRGLDAKGTPVKVTICVAPDYLAVGSNRDFVRVPMGLPAAVEVTKRLGFMLPTTKMVDAIYRQAALHLPPSPMQASRQMSSTAYLWKHNQTVQAQRTAAKATADELIAGQKKDLVMSNALLRAPGRVAIYGWHRLNGKPIQPLSTVHGQSYADYSHGIRLISKTAYVNGKPRALASLLADPNIASVLSKEGPLKRPLRLVASLASR